MKAKITKTIDLANDAFYFTVSADKVIVRCLNYKPNAPEDSVWNEEKNFKKAKDLAELIEKSDTLRIEETIYETKTDSDE